MDILKIKQFLQNFSFAFVSYWIYQEPELTQDNLVEVEKNPRHQIRFTLQLEGELIPTYYPEKGILLTSWVLIV